MQQVKSSPRRVCLYLPRQVETTDEIIKPSSHSPSHSYSPRPLMTRPKFLWLLKGAYLGCRRRRQWHAVTSPYVRKKCVRALPLRRTTDAGGGERASPPPPPPPPRGMEEQVAGSRRWALEGVGRTALAPPNFKETHCHSRILRKGRGERKDSSHSVW